MNDLEQELRTLLETKSRDASVDPTPSARVLKRARRRQLGTTLTTVVGIAAVAIASVVGVQALVHTNSVPPRPAEPPVLPDAPEGFRSAALPFASIAYPEDWYLLDTSPLVWMGIERPYIVPSGPVLQLANFDPDLPRTPKCMLDPDSLPDDGVLLTVGIMTEEEAAITTPPSGPWPAELSPLPSNMDPVCSGSPRIAAWTAPSGVTYWATAGHGPDARETDVRAMERAFASLTFPPTDKPQMSQMAAFQGQGTPRVVLGSDRIGSTHVTIVAFVELNKTLIVGVSSSDGYSNCCLGGAIAPHTGSEDEPISSTVAISPGGTLVYGVISPEVARAELRTSSGETLPVTVTALPASLGENDRVVWGIAPGADERATIVGYDSNGEVIGDPYYPVAPRITVAEGTDPAGGPWILYLEETNEGMGLGFEFENSGGGGGCCLQSLSENFRLDGVGTGGGAPSHITAFGSDALERVVFMPADAKPIDGAVFQIPDETLGVPKVALIIVPEDVVVEGMVIGYDGRGNELGREVVGDFGEPPGPTADIDAVWTLLRDARDAISRWAGQHGGSLADLDVDEARASMPDIPWNASGPGKPVPQEVSLRGAARAGGSELTGWSGWTVALVSATSRPDGSIDTYCIAVNIDERGGGNYRYGVQDAASYEECRGGWPELSG